MMKIENFFKGPLTTLIGFIAMITAGYLWFSGQISDWKAGAAVLVGFALMFMRDQVPGMITQAVKAILGRFSNNKQP